MVRPHSERRSRSTTPRKKSRLHSTAPPVKSCSRYHAHKSCSYKCWIAMPSGVVKEFCLAWTRRQNNLCIFVGGAIGYAKKKSMKSLISGAVSSLLLCYACTQLPVHPVYASSGGLGVSGVLAAVTGIRFKKTGKIFPALFLSLVSFIMAGGYVHGIMGASHA